MYGTNKECIKITKLVIIYNLEKKKKVSRNQSPNNVLLTYIGNTASK